MKKYIILEICSIILLIASIQAYKYFDFNSNYESIALAYFFILSILMFLVFPAAILLSLTEKYFPNKIKPKSFMDIIGKKSSINTSLVFLITGVICWVIFIVFRLFGFNLYQSAVFSGLFFNLVILLIIWRDLKNEKYKYLLIFIIFLVITGYMLLRSSYLILY